MSQKPILYYALFSPPARACLITAKLIGLELELKSVDFAKKEHLKDEFIKLNRQHQVPVFVDTDGEIYVDSHAIICFMVGKYAKTDQLYPNDLKRRAHIDHRLHYESGVLFQVVKDIVARNIYGGESQFNKTSLEHCHNAYETLEQFLEDDFVVGNELSLADVSIYATLLTLHLVVPVEEQRYPKISAWLTRLEELLPDYEEINLKGSKQLQQRILNNMEQHKANAAACSGL